MLVLKQGKLNKNLNQLKRGNSKFVVNKNPSLLKLTKLRQINLSFLDEQKNFIKNKLELRTTFYRLLKLSQVLKTSLKSKNVLPVSEFLFQESFLIKSKIEEKKTQLLLKLRVKLLKKNHFKFLKNLRKVKFLKKKARKGKGRTLFQGKKRRHRGAPVFFKKDGKDNKGVQKPLSSKKQPDKKSVISNDFKSQQHFPSQEKLPSTKKNAKKEVNFEKVEKKVQSQKESSFQEGKVHKKSRFRKRKAEGELKSQEESLSLKEKKEKNDKKSESKSNKKKSK